MSQRQQRGPGSSGSSDIETGKPQDSRQDRHPGEGNRSQDSQQMGQQQPKQGKNEGSQFGDAKGRSQQAGGQQDKQHGQQGASHGDKQYGEGNYAASRDYNQRTKDFVESGRVDEAAKKAAPKNEREAKEMSDAEREGRRPMREEDPQINPDKSADKSKKPGQGPDAKH
jgi:hypothetical protein